MLRFDPQSWFAWSFKILDETDRCIGELYITSFRSDGELNLGEKIYKLYREKRWEGAFILESDGQELARAAVVMEPSGYDVLYGNRRFQALVVSLIHWEFELRENDKVVGTLKQEKPFTRKLIVDLPDNIELHIKLYLAWLVLRSWKEFEGA